MRKLNLAIIGIGHLGSKHLKVYSELVHKINIVGVCDPKARRTKKLANHYKVPFFKSHLELLDKVDAVSICVPTSEHFAVAKDFLSNNIHTLIEKPITTTVKQANELIEIAEKKNLKLQVGHVERFNSAFVSVQKLAKKPVFIEIHRLNRFPHRSLDIGVVMDLMIHDLDIVMGLNKSALKSIEAVGVKVLTHYEDISNARITFDNGCVCNLTASRISDEITRKIRIFTKNSYISLDYVKQEAFIYKKFGKIITKHALPIEKEEPLKQELDHFIECIQKDKEPIVSGKVGKEALEVALKVTDKIWNNHKGT